MQRLTIDALTSAGEEETVMRVHALRQQLLGGALVVVAGMVVACDDSTATEPPVPVAAVLAENAGVEAQSGTVGTTLATPISVLYTRSGQPVAGANVTWKVLAGGGTLDAATSTTDPSGNAVVHWTLGTKAGADTLIGTTADSATSIITAVAVPDVPASITVVSGDAQDIAAGAAPEALVVKAVDKYGNVVPGATVTWTASGGVTVDSSTTTTDSDGIAKVTPTITGAPGTYTVSASVPGVAPVTFTERAE
jgi:adhesin/invasin